MKKQLFQMTRLMGKVNDNVDLLLQRIPQRRSWVKTVVKMPSLNKTPLFDKDEATNAADEAAGYGGMREEEAGPQGTDEPPERDERQHEDARHDDSALDGTTRADEDDEETIVGGIKIKVEDEDEDKANDVENMVDETIRKVVDAYADCGEPIRVEEDIIDVGSSPEKKIKRKYKALKIKNLSFLEWEVLDRLKKIHNE